ncbi:MAG: hypothetical protein ACI9DC_004909 [Gammaproteobacteria bacterium]|jgi:hypothetical protein
MSLNIEAGDNELQEQSDLDLVDNFESSLSARTKVPAERLSDFLGWNENKVRQEAKVVSRILKRFAGAVVQSMEHPDSMDDFLMELDLKTISRDHDWRAIFATVRTHEGDDASQYKRAVLIKYLQYLSFRKGLLDFIHVRKACLEETDELSAELTHVPLAPAGFDESSEVRLGIAAVGVTGFERIPLGETVAVSLGAEEVFVFRLGPHRFELVGGVHPYVVDANGVTCFVRPGRNIMGRHPESDLTVDANFSTVSRTHLVMEWDRGNVFRLMDLSSRGTFLRKGVLKNLHNVQSAEELVAFERAD